MSEIDPSTPTSPGRDAVEEYLARYVEAAERGERPPDLTGLDDDARAEVTKLLGLLGGVDEGSAPDPAGPEPDDEAPGAGGDPATETTGTTLSDGGPRAGGSPGMRPRAESGFALARGFVRPAPDVVVVGDAVRRARSQAGLTVADVATAMTRRGAHLDAAALEALEASRAGRLEPRDARLLAAVLDQPLAAVEARAQPWSSEPGALDEIRRGAAVDAVVLGEDVVVRTARGDHLGALRCPGDAELLDSRTYREAAAALLTGPWSYLAGALLVAEQPPHLALAVDALDCVTRWHAPTGLLGFSRLAEPEPIADALASYDRTYAVHWSDPDPLNGNGRGEDGDGGGTATRFARSGERLRNEARRARQPGKRPGYEAAADWLDAMAPQDALALLDDIAGLDADSARALLTEAVIPT